MAVSLTLRRPSYLEVPSDALVFRGQKAYVVLVQADDKVKFRPVTIADDDGQRARILSGLARGERVALNLGGESATGKRYSQW